MPLPGRTNDSRPFSAATDCETPATVPSELYAVIPPLLMVKDRATTKSMVSSLCVPYMAYQHGHRSTREKV